MRTTTIIIFLLLSTVVLAQEQTVKGVVTAFNKYPLNNVELTSKLSKQQAVTDEYGQFEIKVYNKDVITIKAKGFENQRIKVFPSMKLQKVNLVFIKRGKNETVAVGYGYIKKEHLTYGISNLSFENNDFGLYTDIYDLIVQKSTGVSIIYEGGQKKFLVRGPKSLMGSNAALLVVNGLVVSDLDFLSPQDVASISVLKDSATTAYGSRGANGVIVITTKRGINQ